MKKLILALLAGFGLTAQAQVYSESAFTRHQHAIYGNLTFAQGGIGIGADYEYAADATYGIGGYTRFYQKEEDPPRADGIVAFGAFIRPHFHKKSWDFYLSPGMGIINIDSSSGRDDTTTLGPSLALGLLYQMNDSIAFGIENMKLYVWFDEDYRGLVLDEFSLKLRVNF